MRHNLATQHDRLGGARATAGDGLATVVDLPPDPASAGRARAAVAAAAVRWGLGRVASDAALCASELVTNALLHARTGLRLAVRPVGQGLRVEVVDGVDLPVVAVPPPEPDVTTGRGLRVVAALADRWGVEPEPPGKRVWAEVGTGQPTPSLPAPVAPAPTERAADRRPVRLLGVPVRLAAASDAQVDDLVRELHLVRASVAGRGRAPVSLLEAVHEAARRVAPARWAARDAVRIAAAEGRAVVDLALTVSESALPDLWRMMSVLEQLGAASRDGLLLTPPPSEELSAYRRWLAAEIERQVRGQAALPCPFRASPPDPADGPSIPAGALLATERSAREAAERAATRLASLQAVAAGLTGALGTDEVADVVLGRGVGDLGARAATLCLLEPDGETVAIVHHTGYPRAVRDRWRTFPLSADLPASEVIRTGRPVFLASAEDRDARYPAFREGPALPEGRFAVLPLAVDPGRVFGALSIGFPADRDVTADDREFLTALAEMTAQALDRTRLHDAEAASRDRFAFLAQAGDLLNASLDLDRTLTSLVGLAVPRLADWCAVHLLDDGDPRFVAAAHVDPARRAAADLLFRRWPVRLGEPGIGTVLRDGRPVVVRSVTPELLPTLARDQEHLAHLRSLGFGSAMVVPLTYGGKVVGALSLANGRGRAISDTEVSLAQDLGARAGAAVANARLFAHQSDVARALQASLLPTTLPSRPGVELAARYRAAGRGLEVGGDFYDAFEAGDRLVLAIGDVCGKGVEAATVTGAARHTIRAVALGEPSPATVLRRLNEVLLLTPPPAGDDEPRFCTVAIVAVHPVVGGLLARMAVAGHPAPVLVRADGRVERVAAGGDVVGLFPAVAVADVEVLLEQGDTLVLHTDGLTERHAGCRFFGDEGVEAALAAAAGSPAGAIVDRLEQAVHEAVPGEPADDVAVLVLRVTG